MIQLDSYSTSICISFYEHREFEKSRLISREYNKCVFRYVCLILAQVENIQKSLWTRTLRLVKLDPFLLAIEMIQKKTRKLLQAFFQGAFAWLARQLENKNIWKLSTDSLQLSAKTC